jgi:hypothetical protein
MFNKEGYIIPEKKLQQYKSTPVREWQELTGAEIASIWMHEAVPMNGQDFKRVYRAIEQALRIKNGT